MTGDVGEVVLGVDPGSVSGWGVLTIQAGPKVIGHGKIEFSTPRRGEFRTASQCVRWATTAHTVVLIAIEDQYFDDDPKKIASTIKLCRSAGRWIEAAEEAGIRYKMTNTATWQAAMIGGRYRRDQLKKISRAICAQRYGVAASHHVSDSILIGAYEAVEFYHNLKAPQASARRRPGGKGRGPRRVTSRR